MWHEVILFLKMVIGVAAVIGVVVLRQTWLPFYRDSGMKFQTLFRKDRWWT